MWHHLIPCCHQSVGPWGPTLLVWHGRGQVTQSTDTDYLLSSVTQGTVGAACVAPARGYLLCLLA